MAKKSPTNDRRPSDVYARLATNPVEKIAKTLFLNAQNFQALAAKCEGANEETEKWNLENQKLPRGRREPRRRKIKPCDVIDDLISRHLKGEI